MIVYTPHLRSPVGGEIFNSGVVDIVWNAPSPLSDDEYGGEVTFELEYTDNYVGQDTNWFVAKRRISSSESSYSWNVGKMIKSNSVRVRIRARQSTDNIVSEYSMSSGNFSINVFDLIAPAIVNPVEGRIYNDYILIILDESLTKNTYNQKVRYTLDYSSEQQEVSWTTIIADVPSGQNVIRWNTSELFPADDYVLRLTARNSCSAFPEEQPHQIAKRYVYDIKIRPSGLFIIDTKPPKAVVRIDNNTTYTNQLEHIVNIFAEDQTTEVETVQVRECFSDIYSALGPTSGTTGPTGPSCPTVEELLTGEDINFDFFINKPTTYSIKSQWKFKDESGHKKLEALLTDAGGNLSLSETDKVFLPLLATDDIINDFIITQEQREKYTFEDNQVISEIVLFNVAYVGTENGNYWRLDPFPSLLDSSSINRSILKIYNWAGIRFLFTYINTEEYPDIGSVFKDTGSGLLLLLQLPNPVSKTTAVTVYDSKLYFGLENGELWTYNGSSFALLSTFSNAISDLSSDNVYLYIVFDTSSEVVLYNGTDFTVLTMD